MEREHAVHVSIVDIPVSQVAGGLHISEIAHIPFERSALAVSVDKLITTGVPPARDFDASYKQWKEKGGGIYCRCSEFRIMRGVLTGIKTRSCKRSIGSEFG